MLLLRLFVSSQFIAFLYCNAKCVFLHNYFCAFRHITSIHDIFAYDVLIRTRSDWLDFFSFAILSISFYFVTCKKYLI